MEAGYVVAATDYAGLGTPGVQPYLVGTEEGQNVLDAVRAARNLHPAGAGKHFVARGHSQGGQAALFAGQLARRYAPELNLVGVAAAAPAGELRELVASDIGTAAGIAFTVYVFKTWPKIYPGVKARDILTSDALAALPDLAPQCIEAIENATAPLVGKFFARSPLEAPRWPKLFKKNTPGAVRINAPLFIAQGTGDTIVLPPTTEGLVRRLCTLGETVQLESYPGATHAETGFVSAADAATWISDRFARTRPVPSTC